MKKPALPPLLLSFLHQTKWRKWPQNIISFVFSRSIFSLLHIIMISIVHSKGKLSSDILERIVKNIFSLWTFTCFSWHGSLCLVAEVRENVLFSVAFFILLEGLPWAGIWSRATRKNVNNFFVWKSVMEYIGSMFQSPRFRHCNTSVCWYIHPHDWVLDSSVWCMWVDPSTSCRWKIHCFWVVIMVKTQITYCQFAISHMCD